MALAPDVHVGGKRPFHVASLSWARDGRTVEPANSKWTGGPQEVDIATTPVYQRFGAPTPRLFQADASIALLGVRGAGKSTLAIIASTAMKRQILDAEKRFQDTTGQLSREYKKEHGPEKYHRQQTGVLEEMLVRYQRGAFIVCSWMERHVQVLFQRFAETNPVIFVLRDAGAIRSHLNLFRGAKIDHLLEFSATTFRKCSNFEFFNISEGRPRPGGISDDSLAPGQRSPAPYLTLKRAERHFIKFLYLLMPRGSVPLVESAMPLAEIPLEDRMFTYAVVLPVSRLEPDEFEIQDIETGADAIEIMVDDLDVLADHMAPSEAESLSQKVAFVRRNTAIPIIYHVPLQLEGEAKELVTSHYMEAVEHGVRLGAEYITVDLRLAHSQLQHIVRTRGRSKVIGHLDWGGENAPSWKDPRWLSFYEAARQLQCDIVRFTRPAVEPTDEFEVQNLRATLEGLDGPAVPLIAYNTGLFGRHSACFNRTATAVRPGSWTVDEPPSRGASTRLPVITALQATAALYSSYVLDEMKLYVFGANVEYSMSPAMHNAALVASGIPHRYRPYSTSSISGLRNLIWDTHFAGASIGLPFKVEIISLVDRLSRHARVIGAANTLIPVRHLNKDGSVPDGAAFFNHRNRAGPIKALYGENTDWIGILACIRRGLSPANAVRPQTCGLVVGAGGMARAAVYAMMQLGVQNIAILNRTRSNAEKLIGHFNRILAKADLSLLCGSNGTTTKFRIIESWDDPWPDDLRYPTIFVSCIPTHAIGDSPAPDFTLPARWLNSPTGGVVVELAYKTLKTPLLEQVRREAPRGWVAMDGLDLLPEQGFAQFELFTGRRAPRRLMRREVLRAYPDGEDGSNLARLRPRLESIVDQEP